MSSRNKVVISPNNKFALSEDFLQKIKELGYNGDLDPHFFEKERHNPFLVDAVEKFKPEHLKVVEISGRIYRIWSHEAGDIIEDGGDSWEIID